MTFTCPSVGTCFECKLPKPVTTLCTVLAQFLVPVHLSYTSYQIVSFTEQLGAEDMFINLKPWQQHRGFLSIQGIYCHHVANTEWGLNRQRIRTLGESNYSGRPLTFTKCIAVLCDGSVYFSYLSGSRIRSFRTANTKAGHLKPRKSSFVQPLY